MQVFKTISALLWSAVPLEDAVIEFFLVKNTRPPLANTPLASVRVKVKLTGPGSPALHVYSGKNIEGTELFHGIIVKLSLLVVT